MKKNVLYVLLVIALVFFVTALFLFIKSSGNPVEQKSSTLLAKNGKESLDPVELKVKAFFFSEASSGMKPVEYRIEVSRAREVGYQRFLEILMKGAEGCISPVPEDVKIRSLYYVAKQNMLVLDFSEELSQQFPGGTSSELEFIYFIVDNICYNFKEIQKVKFLISGNEAQTISGHIDLENPFYPDYQYLEINE